MFVPGKSNQLNRIESLYPNVRQALRKDCGSGLDNASAVIEMKKSRNIDVLLSAVIVPTIRSIQLAAYVSPRSPGSEHTPADSG
jgi:hypothetical protein